MFFICPFISICGFTNIYRFTNIYPFIIPCHCLTRGVQRISERGYHGGCVSEPVFRLSDHRPADPGAMAAVNAGRARDWRRQRICRWTRSTLRSIRDRRPSVRRGSTTLRTWIGTRVSGWLLSSLRERCARVPDLTTASVQDRELLAILGHLASPLQF
ncbi:MAG: hypothetical protein E6J90_36510 [Deltaproteobacteria bacterium]|nr:MAG: hypothetical protein E6J90_36510 [Deltaproteobacteria bacterium]